MLRICLASSLLLACWVSVLPPSNQSLTSQSPKSFRYTSPPEADLPTYLNTLLPPCPRLPRLHCVGPDRQPSHGVRCPVPLILGHIVLVGSLHHTALVALGLVAEGLDDMLPHRELVTRFLETQPQVDRTLPRGLVVLVPAAHVQ